MNDFLRAIRATPFLWWLSTAFVQADTTNLDRFQTGDGWTLVRAEGVNVALSVENSAERNTLRFDYDFTKGSGYGGLQKRFSLDLPGNYEFSFWLKAESPANNLEIKFLDETGENVWWVQKRNYAFPAKWTRIRVKPRHMQFAWGPTADRRLKRVDRLEFTVASAVGGKGTLWLADLCFTPLPPEPLTYPKPLATALRSLDQHPPDLMLDGSPTTFWQSDSLQPQFVSFDFTRLREFGGLEIHWREGHAPQRFGVQLSPDGRYWDQVYAVSSNRAQVSFIWLPEAEARHVRLELPACAGPEPVGVAEVRFLDLSSTATLNDILIYAAKHSPVGDYPRYFTEQASCWTIAGVSGDTKRALLNEDGMVEPNPARFSLEPIIRLDKQFYNWSNVKSEQSLGSPKGHGSFEFVPTVRWRCGDLQFETSLMAAGRANVDSVLGVRYGFENLSTQPLAFEFYVLFRPFQVNPYYQFLNRPGGAGTINSIRQNGPRLLSVDDQLLLLERDCDAFGAGTLDQGNLVESLRAGSMPAPIGVTDENGRGQGVMKYCLQLKPREATSFLVVAPFHEAASLERELADGTLAARLQRTVGDWNSKVGHIQFNLPPSADALIAAYKANLGYILLNRNRAGFQPGSRSYARSWIRDGALISSALLKSGIAQEVRDFIEWYAAHQYESGKIPCVVDARGPDPVPENDSHGEMIYLIREYFNFTRDTAFLRSQNKTVLKATDYLQSLIAQRSTDYYRTGSDNLRACYGLVPESISHEGYSAKPMHSYWDDFFVLKGLKDAAAIQAILGETAQYQRINQLGVTFAENLYCSLQLAMRTHGINYLPGCVELGDFDATSTTIALTPCNELNRLPRPQVCQTFDRYYEFFKGRRDSNTEWVNYTPYENRLIGSFVLLDQPERAHELIDYFLKDQSPPGWSQWAEVVWKNHREPQFIGDMPHTWVGSDFVNAVRTLFLYEDEADQSLVLAPALRQDWIDAPNGMSVARMPTYYGEVSYSIKKTGRQYVFSITGDVKLPEHGIKIRNFNRSLLPLQVTVNGVDSRGFTQKEIEVSEMPATVAISY